MCGITLNAGGESNMPTKLLAIAMVLTSLFGAQQAVAKSSTKTKTTATTKKKHHKKHPKKAATTRIMALTA
jgi:hypothetical protein